MFARVRRNFSSPPSSGATENGTISNSHHDSGHSGKHRIRRGHSSNGSMSDAESASNSLDELRSALNRLETLTQSICDANRPVEGSDDSKTNSNGNNKGLRSSIKKSKIQDAGDGPSPMAGAADGNSSAAAPNTPTKLSNNDSSHSSLETPKNKSIHSVSSSNSAGPSAPTDATFLRVSRKDESEMIELLRRIAELVVISERKSSQIINSKSIPEEVRKLDDGDKGGDDEKESQEENDNEDLAMPYLALFELFCERNALSKIVNIVTGVAFLHPISNINSKELKENEAKSDNSDMTPPKQTKDQASLPTQPSYLLPPLSVATQAIQSVSILIQNVSRATSLYFLLSNNRVNDLIKLPLNLYQRAEVNAINARYNSLRRSKGQTPPPSYNNYQSPEMGELTTHFVSFLKSLAMRVNAETLQFFLSFPLMSQTVAGRTDNQSTDESAATDESPSTTSATPVTKVERLSTSSSSDLRRLSGAEKRRVVEFPLYASALTFIPSDDSFVRVTAMNVCMNIIRLATHSSETEDDGGGMENNDDDAPTKTPSGALHEAPGLPLQDRVAIAQYACNTRRVSDLVGPLCARLTSQFGQVEGAVRSLEELANAPIPSENNRQKAKMEKSKIEKRNRLKNTIHDLMANVQDELLLLDDLLKVGLISLNEQSIEMMLATFVYPMLLQPLLLPLHRYSSSKQPSIQQQLSLGGSSKSTKSGSSYSSDLNQKQLQTPQKSNKSKIVLQSPPPFKSNTSSEISSDVNASPTPSNISNSEQPSTTHSSNEMDLAPSKTALFGLSVIFHSVSNPTFRHLLLTALLHPFSPEATGGVVIRALPQVTKRNSEPLQIRMEESFQDFEKQDSNFPVYSFGTKKASDDDTKGSLDDSNEDICIFILASALVDMLRNNSNPSSEDSEDGKKSVRLNPYRKILLSSISGSAEMVSLQALAIAALHAAVSSVDGWIIRKIMFPTDKIDGPLLLLEEGSDDYVFNKDFNSNVREKDTVKNDELESKPSDESDIKNASTQSTDDSEINNTSSALCEITKQTLKYLCVSVVNTTITRDGWWKVNFNRVAAKTLMDLVTKIPDFLNDIDDLMVDIRLDAAKFLMSLPALLDAKSREGTDTSKTNAIDNQHLESWLLDRFYFDQADKSSTSVVEHVCYLKEESESSDTKSQYRYGLEVLSKSSVADASVLLCEDSIISDNMIVSSSKGDTPFVCATSWAMLCLYLDAFCTKLLKAKTSLDERPVSGDASDVAPLDHKRLSYISETGSLDDASIALSYSLAHISSKFAIAMLDEGETSDKKGEFPPPHGSIVELGRAAFPCVCEVSPTFSSLFTGRTCVSNEGIQWQSLYLIVIGGKWAVLAEPERGSGGEGRVITACRLACLAIKKDTSMLANNNTPARRLLVAHSSLDPRPPPLFLLDSNSARRGPSLGPDGLRLTRSRMDLWFEDSNAAGHAWKVLSAKIAKARARRGGRIRSALLSR